MAVVNNRFDDLCRLCAAKTGAFQAINIFEDEGALRQISEKIQSCLPVQVHETDQLPKRVCQNCIYKLELFYDFRDRTIKTERLLTDLCKEINASQSAINVIIHQGELIALQHLNETNLQNVNKIQESEHCEGAILTDSLVLKEDLSTEIDLKLHELVNPDLVDQQADSNVDTSNLVSLDHLHQDEDSELLIEQFRLERELQQEEEQSRVDNCQQEDPLKDCLNYEAQIPSADGSLHLTEIPTMVKIESLQQDDSESEHASEHSLCIDEDDLKNTNVETNFNVNEPICTIEQEESTSKIMQPTEQPTEQFNCNICDEVFPSKNEYKMHYNTHLFSCSLCFAMFISLELMNLHRKESHGADIELPTVKKSDAMYSNSSDESGLDNDNKDDLKGEEEVDDPAPEDGSKKRKKVKTLKVCKECGRSFKTNYKLNEHMRKHSGERPYKCTTCEKAFRSKIGLEQHEAQHTGHYKFSCPTCGKGFQCRGYLLVHQRVHSDAKPFSCSTCGKNFKTKQSLADHMNRHLGVKPYVCEHCNRGFVTKGLLKGHQRVHSGEDNRKFACKLCDKMFASKSYLKTHLLIHTGERPFRCKFCDKGFVCNVDLRIHTTLHTGEKSFVCEVCGKAFARADALKCHIRSHTGERPYACDTCGQSFAQFTSLTVHKRKHTGEKPYACELCDMKFISNSRMVTHSRQHFGS